MKKNNRGFALLIAVIFMSVMLAFGLALGALAYKQSVLSSSSIESQHAFYAADAILECVLYYDQQQGSFAYPTTDPGIAPALTCGGVSADGTETSYTSGGWVLTYRVSLDNYCADVTIYKDTTPQPWTTRIFSQGYDVPCNSGQARFSSRGLEAHY